MTQDELRNAIASACDIMRRAGPTTMDYMEQLSWLLFLKSFEETNAPAGLNTGNNLEAEAAFNILAGDLPLPQGAFQLEGALAITRPDGSNFSQMG